MASPFSKFIKSNSVVGNTSPFSKFIKSNSATAEDVATKVAEDAAVTGEKGLLAKLFSISSKSRIGKGLNAGASASLPVLLGLQGLTAGIKSARSGTTDASTIRRLLADPKLLERLVNDTIDTGDLDAFIAARDMERLGKLGIQSPKTLDTLRALVSGSDTPRLARGETRIGSGNDTEILDKILSRAKIFGS